MEGKGISVIIPIYNAAKFLEKCIQSVLGQGDCIAEVICVDDGSRDESCSIVEGFQKKDGRIQLVRTEHTGASHARNLGKSLAKGEYLLFVDADDYLLSNRLTALLRKARKDRIDILVFGGRAEDVWHAPEWVQRAVNTRNKRCGLQTRISWFQERGAFPVVWNKLFRRKIIEEVEFPEQLVIAEDNVFQFEAFLKAEKVVFCAKKVYVYCSHSTSAIVSNGEEKRKEQNLLAVQLVEQKLLREGKMEQFQNEFSLWKSRLDGSRDNIKRSKPAVVANYLKEYGIRSAIEHTIGKYFIKK